MLGLRAIWAKDETARFGLNAFKSAGATFAIETLRDEGVLAAGATVACASEGNHGRAVARAARDAGCACHVYMAATAAGFVHGVVYVDCQRETGAAIGVTECPFPKAGQ